MLLDDACLLARVHDDAALLLIGLLYTVIVYIGYTRGFGAVTPPVLNIAPEEYYRWETFFGLPAFARTFQRCIPGMASHLRWSSF